MVHNYGPEGWPYSDQRVRHRLFLLMGSSLCLLLLRNYWGNSVDVQQALHFDLDPSMTAGQGREILFGNLDVWRVVVCVRFSSETTQPICPMVIPINWANNVDVQCALHFDLDPSMTAVQGHKILRFCEFRFLTGSSLCSFRTSSKLFD